MRKTVLALSMMFAFVIGSASLVNAQETPPAPSSPKAVSVPPVQEKNLSNGLTVAVVERRSVPLVTIQLLVKSGADSESDDKAGLANLTASMLTKGTTTRSATQIAEAVEFLGGSINSGAGWNNSFLSITVTSDKVDQALAILSDLVMHPKFDDSELELLKSQTLDNLTYNLRQPSFIANYVASKFTFGEHPAGGTPSSIASIKRADVVAFHAEKYIPDNAVLIFTGDITAAKAVSLSGKALAGWTGKKVNIVRGTTEHPAVGQTPLVSRMLVIDLPNSGQAAVTYAKPVFEARRSSSEYYPAIVLNSVFGGGYSSRLNYEIRIKRGLSYGAGSQFGWRSESANFATRIQTKNESAAQVAELVLAELRRIGDTSVGKDELVPRKSVLTGNFGRNLETTSGLAAALSDLYAFGISPNKLNSYVTDVNGVTDGQIKAFGSGHLPGGDMIIVGDYSIFKDDLAKRFPNMKIDVIKASDLDISKPGLHK
jgi:zinc protease